MEAQVNQSVRFRAKIVIYAHVSTVTRELRWDFIRPWCLPADVHVDVLHWPCRGSILPHLVFIPLRLGPGEQCRPPWECAQRAWEKFRSRTRLPSALGLLPVQGLPDLFRGEGGVDMAHADGG